MTTSPHVDSAPTSYHNSTRQPKREAVLILVHGDGWLEAYAQKQVDVRIQMVPKTTPAGQILAEEYVELFLPRRYRDVYFPGLRRAADMTRVVRPSDIAWRDWELELLRGIQQLGTHQSEGHKVWTL